MALTRLSCLLDNTSDRGSTNDLHPSFTTLLHHMAIALTVVSPTRRSNTDQANIDIIRLSNVGRRLERRQITAMARLVFQPHIYDQRPGERSWTEGDFRKIVEPSDKEYDDKLPPKGSDEYDDACELAPPAKRKEMLQLWRNAYHAMTWVLKERGISLQAVTDHDPYEDVN